jgi:glycosyltransferase involved in cell wall biosynthesis
MKWICCQLGAREHYAVPRALYRQGGLELLVTDTWLSTSNRFGIVNRRMRDRFHADLVGANIFSTNFGSVNFEMRNRFSPSTEWKKIVRRNQWFEKFAVKTLSQLDVKTQRTLFAYSYAAKQILKFARARGWRTVLGQIDPGPREERIVANLYAKDALQKRHWQARPKEMWIDWQEECEIADRIVVNSQWSQASLVEAGIPLTKIRVVPLAYDGVEGFRRFYPEAFTVKRPLRLLFLGQINLRKGMGPLFEAIRSLEGQPVEFWFVGPVQIAIPPDLRNQGHVRWIGQISRNETDRYYREADVFIFPTFSDGFGLTQLEAQRWGLPVISTPFCGDVVEEGRNGWVLSEVTSAAIAGAVLDILQNPRQLRQLAKNSFVGMRFSLNRIGDQLLGAFD